MDPRSDVLLRQAELFDGELLLAGLPADDLLGVCRRAAIALPCCSCPSHAN
jgi:16S rRNA (guanine1207-N2)-methyltransferase